MSSPIPVTLSALLPEEFVQFIQSATKFSYSPGFRSPGTFPWLDEKRTGLLDAYSIKLNCKCRFAEASESLDDEQGVCIKLGFKITFLSGTLDQLEFALSGKLTVQLVAVSTGRVEHIAPIMFGHSLLFYDDFLSGYKMMALAGRRSPCQCTRVRHHSAKGSR